MGEKKRRKGEFFFLFSLYLFPLFFVAAPAMRKMQRTPALSGTPAFGGQ